LLDNLKTGLSVTVVVGENGAGKSRLLKEVAVRERNTRSVYAISNTIYDRFVNMRRIRRISANSGRHLPLRILKSAIASASAEGLFRLRTISETLNYCGYGSRIGLRIKFRDAFSKGYSHPVDPGLRSYVIELVRNAPEWDGLDINELSSILSLVLNSEYIGQDGLFWLVFDESSVRRSQSDQAARIFAWEAVLRSLGVVDRIELFLQKGDGVSVPLAEASSGQLTLIACLVFLSVVVTDEAVVLIDEPENSLHPRWQREYVERLLDILSFRQPTIIIATHAPIIVSGAQLIEDASVEIFRLTPNGLEQVSRSLRPGEKTSLEETLFESFGTVTPANHFISETLSKEFTKLRAGTTTANEVALVVQQMREGSFDPQQARFLETVALLARTVEAERNNFGESGA
jgi:hypothetical protein